MALKRIPSIKSVMTPFPYTIEAGATLREARQMMTEHDIHHLPVTKDQQLVGMISDLELRLAEAVSAKGIDSVDAICTRNALVVQMRDPLDGVVLRMAQRRYDAAVVERYERVAGILTMRDVCRLLGELLREQFITPTGNDAA